MVMRSPLSTRFSNAESWAFASAAVTVWTARALFFAAAGVIASTIQHFVQHVENGGLLVACAPDRCVAIRPAPCSAKSFLQAEIMDLHKHRDLLYGLGLSSGACSKT